MTDTAGALQRAVFSALAGNAALAAALRPAGSTDRPRIWDRVPELEGAGGVKQPPVFPYLTIGDDDIIDDSTGCAVAWEVFVRVHVWSRAVGRIEAKRLAGLVEDALRRELDVAGCVCVEHEFRATRFITDPDGLTTHAVVELRYLLDGPMKPGAA